MVLVPPVLAKEPLGSFAVSPAFRTQTPTAELAFGVLGVQVTVALVDQSFSTVQVMPSETHHLN